jgi:hypothetical protein
MQAGSIVEVSGVDINGKYYTFVGYFIKTTTYLGTLYYLINPYNNIDRFRNNHWIKDIANIKIIKDN